jgi:hypothetical protein
MMKQTGLLISFFFFAMLVFAQNDVSYSIETGIENIEKQYINAWKKIKKTDGFRIQIVSFSGVNSKSSIDKAAAQFRQQFPDVPCHISFFEPYFRLRAGNYSTKLEAYRALKEIISSFSGAFVVKDLVDISQ